MLHRGAVTVSSTGAENQFQVDDNGHVGRPCEVSLTPPYPELFASYGASAVTRTSGRGHVEEARTNVIEVSGLSESMCVCVYYCKRNIGRGVTNRDYVPFGKRRYLGNK